MRAWLGDDIKIVPAFDEKGNQVWKVRQHDQPTNDGDEGFTDYQDALAYARELHEAK